MSKARYKKASHRVERLTPISTLHTARNIGSVALLVLATTLLLVGCPDDAGSSGATPTEATKVQSALSTALSAHSVTLNWDLPTDSAGYLGATISEENNAGNLSDPVEVAPGTTTYTVTGLEPATEYTFTIATRYTDSGKNNTTTVAVTTGALPSDDTQVQNAASSAVTTTSLTLNWDLPADTDGYEGVTISIQSPADSAVTPVELDENATTHEFTDLGSAVDFIFTIATRYSDVGKNNSTTVAVTTLGVPTDDTRVQNITRAAFSTTTITLNWELPNDLRGYLGATISEENNAGNLSPPQQVDQDTTEYQVTGLAFNTPYTFTIATRYADSGKNNTATATYMTAGPTDVQSVTFNNAETTSDSITLTWDDPDDTTDYTGVTITPDSTIGDLNTPYSATSGINTLVISGLTAATDYTPTFTFATEYSGGKSGSSTMHPLSVTTQSNLVTGVVASVDTSDTVTISWTAPEDTTGYSGVMISADSTVGSLTTTPQSVSQGTNTLTISGLTAGTTYTPNITIATEYTGSKSGGSGVYMVSFTTQSNMVTNIVVSVDTSDTITISWSDPEDTVGYIFVGISADSITGSLTGAETVPQGTNTLVISGLTADTLYTRIFTFTTQYSTGNSGFSSATRTFTTQSNRVTNIIGGDITSDSATIRWGDPEDTVDYTGVMITVDSAIGSLTGTDSVSQGTNTFTISDLDANTLYTRTFTVATQYTGSKSGGSDVYMVSFTTQSNLLTGVVASPASAPGGAAITLSWSIPEDTTDYTGVSITATPTIPTVTVGESATSATITGLAAVMPHTFTLTTQYSGGKSGGDATIMITTPNPFDADADTLIDISSLDQLHNTRHNLDGTSYKTSDMDAGTMCGADATTTCTGYELTRNLDFADGASYDNGMVNNNWRPNAMADSSGAVLAQSNAENATNAGWPLIGSCNADNGDPERNSDPCSGNNTPFSTTFEGNSFVISNLYARNTNTSAGDGISLFAVIDSSSTIRNLGVANSALYGSSNRGDIVGGLVGRNGFGTISNSYVTNSTVDGGAGTVDRVGGLVGQNFGSITSSYATNSTVDGGAGIGDYVGGLVGENSHIITSSYASGTANGGEGNDRVGGLVGSNHGTITTNSYATGTANGGGGIDDVGGLAGYNGDTITDSYATGTADGGTESDNVGGLVGELSSAVPISNSYASGMVHGGTGADSDNVGGLVGQIESGSITTSYYTTGTVSGGEGDDNVGGLVGAGSGITTSYASGTVNGGDGNDDVGGLVGAGVSISASYTSGTVNGGDGNDDVGGLVGDGGRISISYASATVNGGDGDDNVGGLLGEGGFVIASYATGTANGGNDNDDVGGLVGEHNDAAITVSYASGTATGGDGNDNVGGLVGDQNDSITASYATGDVDGGTEDDNVGGLVGTHNSPISASYAVGNSDGGAGTADRVGSLIGFRDGTFTSTTSYGFGTSANGEITGEDDSGDRPSAASVATGTGRTGAALLLAPDPSDSTNTAVPATWNDADHNTLDAWDFGGTSDLPALHYADYDGDGTEYGCGGTSGTIATIPNTVPDGAGGTMTVNCGVTLLPGQGR